MGKNRFLDDAGNLQGISEDDYQKIHAAIMAELEEEERELAIKHEEYKERRREYDRKRRANMSKDERAYMLEQKRKWYYRSADADGRKIRGPYKEY